MPEQSLVALMAQFIAVRSDLRRIAAELEAQRAQLEQRKEDAWPPQS